MIFWFSMAEISKEELYRTLEEHYFGPNMHEKKEIEALPQLLKGVHVFVDVGASLGQYTYFANRVMTGGVIYAIEGDPVRFERLSELCREWSKDPGSNRIVPLNVALSNTVGSTRFFATDADRSGGLFPHEGTNAGTIRHDWKEIQVRTETLDNLFRDEEPDMVKIDVEGAEYRVLLGSARILNKGKARYMVEVHPWGDPTFPARESDVFDLFAGFSYDFKRLHHHWLFARTESRLRLSAKNKLVHLALDHPAVRRNAARLISMIRR
jgi:FkbM family methyltransferase